MRVVVLGGGVAGEHFVGALRRRDDAAALDRAPGLAPARPDPAGVCDWRDARVVRAGVVDVDGEELAYDRLVLAPGQLTLAVARARRSESCSKRSSFSDAIFFAGRELVESR